MKRIIYSIFPLIGPRKRQTKKSNIRNVFLRQILIISALVISILIVGTAGFMLLEDYSILDAFFFTVITISTVGYSLPKDLSSAGKLLAVFLIFAGISIVLYGISDITTMILEGKIQEYLRIRRNKKMVEKMKNHIIVVGCGKTGQYVIAELLRGAYPFIVIDMTPDNIKKIEDLSGKDIPKVIGDAEEEETLLNAGISTASTLITTLPDDLLNVFVVLSARSINPKLKIISRVADITSINKLIRAGATTTVAEAEIAGTRMARLAIKPETVDFFDIVAFGSQSFRIEEISLSQDSNLVGATLSQLSLSKIFGTMVIAIQREGKVLFAPTGGTTLKAGDKLVVLGEIESIQKLREHENI